MKRMIWALAALAFLAAGGRAGAGIVTFDDLPNGGGVVPNGYGGVNWSGNWDYYGGSQPPYNAHSGLNRIYTDYGSPAAGQAGENSFSFQAPEVFQGAWFAGYANADLKFSLYFHNVLVFTSADLQPSSTPTFLASGYFGVVDKVGVSSQANDYYIMDDVTFRNPERAGAPEPAGLTLLGIGTAALASYLWRRRGARIQAAA
jgi:hypothetical protein